MAWDAPVDIISFGSHLADSIHRCMQSVSTRAESRDLMALMWRFSRVTITAGRPDWFGGEHTLHGGRRQQPIISSSFGIWYRDLLMLARGDNDG